MREGVPCTSTQVLIIPSCRVDVPHVAVGSGTIGGSSLCTTYININIIIIVVVVVCLYNKMRGCGDNKG